jgi:HK97 gp10 family phage protein
MAARVTVKSRLAEIATQATMGADDRLRQSAERIAQGAVQRAPRRTGELAESIGVEQIGPFEYAVVADIPWRFLEFGTVKMGAQPFMVPAAEAERDNLVRSLGGLFR